MKPKNKPTKEIDLEAISARFPGFVAMPSDPKVKCTREQLEALFAGDRGALAQLPRQATAESEVGK